MSALGQHSARSDSTYCNFLHIGLVVLSTYLLRWRTKRFCVFEERVFLPHFCHSSSLLPALCHRFPLSLDTFITPIRQGEIRIRDSLLQILFSCLDNCNISQTRLHYFGWLSALARPLFCGLGLFCTSKVMDAMIWIAELHLKRSVVRQQIVLNATASSWMGEEYGLSQLYVPFFLIYIPSLTAAVYDDCRCISDDAAELRHWGLMSSRSFDDRTASKPASLGRCLFVASALSAAEDL